MVGSANIKDIQALRELRSALLRFAEEVKSTLEQLDLEVQREMRWLEHEQPRYWSLQLRMAYERISEARSALSTAEMRTVAGHKPECIDEKKALRKWKQRLEHVEEKTRITRSWSLKAQREVDDFYSRIGQLRLYVETQLPGVQAWLERMSASLERYAEMGQEEEFTTRRAMSGGAGPGSGSMTGGMPEDGETATVDQREEGEPVAESVKGEGGAKDD